MWYIDSVVRQKGMKNEAISVSQSLFGKLLFEFILE